ncbi:hypothetical protein KAU11_05340 [Candidatus Babeliales bacterium]|nr:hypothetical protein [Candidatus Babeliales bacterium]
MKFKKIIVLLTLAIFSHLKNTNLEAMDLPLISALLIGGEGNCLSKQPDKQDNRKEMERVVKNCYECHKMQVLYTSGKAFYIVTRCKNDGKHPLFRVISLSKSHDDKTSHYGHNYNGYEYFFRIVEERREAATTTTTGV